MPYIALDDIMPSGRTFSSNWPYILASAHVYSGLAYKVMLCKLARDAIPEVRRSFCHVLLVSVKAFFGLKQ